ncbi:MAG: Dam family site-specific DNA-(adenine-N6)-methyltransferase, partial [Saprospiraceae bacterium]|nr:Dam family site-specific DNA-(adenine-N6)-methyltransferase [Saprospiraceae bacterium]
MKAKPFLKWAGGKTQLLPQFEGFYPSILKKRGVKRYVEPFVGSGAVFFNLMSRYHFETAYISDLNEDLILCYKTIKDRLEPLLESLKIFQSQFDSKAQDERAEMFLEVRHQFNEKKKDFDYSTPNEQSVIRASQFIFLNKTCFNGLFRLNSKGGFNVPYGGYESAKILDVGNLRAVSALLQRTEICCADYSECEKGVDDKTFVYLDPPYRPLNKTSSFTAYVGNGFSDVEQRRLA